MSQHLPQFSGAEVVQAPGQIGFAFDRRRSSHLILRHIDPPHRRAVVPDHKTVAKGTLRAIIRDAGLTVDESRALL